MSKPPKVAIVSPAAPSKPVVIPTRTRPDRRSSNTHPKAERAAGGRNVPHDSKAVPPSVAAFLAITDIKQKPALRPRPDGLQRYKEEDSEEAAENEQSGVASSASSPHSWRLLLSPPHDIDDDGSGFRSDDTMLGSLSPLRSLSNESMPSLDTDTESTYASSSPSTPGLPIQGQALRERRSKSISSSVPEDCGSDHPLLIVCSEPQHKSRYAAEDLAAGEAKLTPCTKPSLRSNLTASLRRLKSAARTFSNLTVPPLSQDEYSPYASLSAMSKIVPERRPLPWTEPPDPALRRYLNPITISPAELYAHGGRDETNTNPTASIQMQTYWPGARKSEKASAPPTFVLASSDESPADEPAVSTTPRQREPRENSDFLRVIVLEMNMRKVGKLSDVAPGRARLWLPARQAPTRSGDVGINKPRRWVPVSP
ncbi:MAG: hypothetical protein Q9225_001580 [Loekoesia sp. 1 TL-2023]